ncbi:MAG: hypothetical protein AAF298_11415 [Cyanobacteria bacterium P01_A01_bin.40]
MATIGKFTTVGHYYCSFMNGSLFLRKSLSSKITRWQPILRHVLFLGEGREATLKPYPIKKSCNKPPAYARQSPVKQEIYGLQIDKFASFLAILN